MSDDLGQQIIDAVEKRGWYVVNVLPAEDGSDGDERCSYTIGLGKSLHWPELICFGRVADEAFEMLRLTIAECWERQITPHDGLLLRKVLQRFPVKVASNAALGNYLGLAEWYAEQAGLAKPDRLQLLWPDDQGRFPDDPDCDPEIRAIQTPRTTA